MTIHVNIGEAKTRLSELLRALRDGERVIISRDGQPEAELIPARRDIAVTAEERLQRRLSAFGMYGETFKNIDTSLDALKSERGDPDERFERKFGPAT